MRSWLLIPTSELPRQLALDCVAWGSPQTANLLMLSAGTGKGMVVIPGMLPECMHVSLDAACQPSTRTFSLHYTAA